MGVPIRATHPIPQWGEQMIYTILWLGTLDSTIPPLTLRFPKPKPKIPPNKLKLLR